MVAIPAEADIELHVRACSDCGKAIMWAKTVGSGGVDWEPLDAEPDPRATFIVYPDPAAPRRLLVDTVRREDHRRYVAAGWPMRQHHRWSCPRADAWARKPRHLRPGPTGVAPAPAVSTPPPPDEEATLW